MCFSNHKADLIGNSHEILEKRIVYQLYGDMTIEMYGSVWSVDHCIQVSSFNLLDENEKKKSFDCVNLKPMYSNENNLKKAKIVQRFYLLREFKAK